MGPDTGDLLQGETGTGKELLARAVHQQSFRRDHPLVTVNCAAMPSGLLESELFGHERGAFTGAVAQKLGRFELAYQGTLVLDEIGDLPLELQPKLLRVLQEQEFERLGSTRARCVDVRLVAATNRELAPMVEDGQFRADLYYRLNVFPITVPPLRQRAADIPLLVRHFVRHYARQLRKRIDSIPADTMAALTHDHWPGNVRELQHVIERAVILSPGPVLRLVLDERPRSQPAPWRCGAPRPATHDIAVSPGEARDCAAAVVTACLHPSGTPRCTVTVRGVWARQQISSATAPTCKARSTARRLTGFPVVNGKPHGWCAARQPYPLVDRRPFRWPDPQS